MYLSEKPRPIDFYKEEGGREMMMEVVSNGGLPPQQQQQQMILAESSGEDHEVKAPKKRAETWVQEETRSLINLRREVDNLFNTSKSNKHLWEQISTKMREKGFDRSPTMCTDKWRNLLKEFKKAKQQDRGSGSAKMSYYKELEDLLRERIKNAPYKSPTPSSKVDSYMQFSDKGAVMRFVFWQFSFKADVPESSLVEGESASDSESRCTGRKNCTCRLPLLSGTSSLLVSGSKRS